MLLHLTETCILSIYTWPTWLHNTRRKYEAPGKRQAVHSGEIIVTLLSPVIANGVPFFFLSFKMLYIITLNCDKQLMCY